MTTTVLSPDFLHDLANILRRQVVRYNARRVQRAESARVFDELSAMSDHDLADIGISRVQIVDIARQAAASVRV